MRGRSKRPRGEASRLAIETLGSIALRVGGRAVPIPTRKSRALIGYLALADEGAESRERLVGLLWSETDEDKARASLRQSLHGIRKALEAAGFAGFSADKLMVSFTRARLSVDLWDVIEDAKVGRAHPLLLERERLIDLLLRDVETVDQAFRVWLLAKRQSLHDRLIRLLELAMRNPDSAQAACEDIARALLNLDPTHEEAARERIRARVADGDIGAALHLYKNLWDLLEREYDVEPSEETQALIAQVRMEQGTPESPRPSPPKPPPAKFPRAKSPAERAAAPAIRPAQPVVRSPDARIKPTITIRPFEMASAALDHHYLVQGFRRELIACLVRFREWFVCEQRPERTSPGGPADEYQIEATTLQSGGGLRLVLTLRDVASERYLWSERVEIALESWFDAQQVIVRRIATTLNVHLSAARLAHLAHLQGNDLHAFDLWLQGQAMLLSFDSRTWEAAAQLFREAIAQSPTFAPAYSSLAQQFNAGHIALPGIFRDAQRTAQALAYAREAGRLDPVDSRSQLCLGWSHAMARQYEQAEIYLRLAHELNDNDSWTLISSANCFAFCGAQDRARELADYTLKLPLAPSPLQWAYHVAIRFMQADYEGCIAAAEHAGDVNPNVPGFKASALHHLGRRDAARTEVRRFFDVVRKRWVGQEPASDKAITCWFLHLFPIRRPDDWERLRDGMAGAGAPAADLQRCC